MNKTETTITFSAPAMETIERMGFELHRIESLFGNEDPRYVKAAASLAASLIQLINLRPTRVHSDGNHSLIAQAEYITFGVNYCGTSYNDQGVGDWSVNS